MVRLCDIGKNAEEESLAESSKCGGEGECEGEVLLGKMPRIKIEQREEDEMTCKECSAKTGSNVWLCSGVKGGDVLPCHIDYHKFNFNKVFPSTAGG